MRRRSLSDLQLPAVPEIVRDVGRSKGVATNLHFDPCGERSPSTYAPDT